MRTLASLPAITMLSVALATSALAREINVPADYPTIQAAIDAAQTNDVVIVAPGTYPENINFNGKAITVRSSGGAGVTTIDGHNLDFAVTFETGEPRAAVVQGFTFTQGGLYSAWGAPTIQECTFVNQSGAFGTGCYMPNSSTLVTDCVFRDNQLQYGDAALLQMFGNTTQQPIVRNCTFENNTAGAGYFRGVAIFLSDPNIAATVENCTFANNHAQSGVVFVQHQNGSTIRGCTFTENTATGWGGGVFVGDTDTNPMIQHCLFQNNSSAIQGGAVLISFAGGGTFSDCRFSGNQAPLGGAVYAQNLSSPVNFVRCDFTTNTATWNGGAIRLQASQFGIECLDCHFLQNATGNTGGGGGTVDLDGVGGSTFRNCVFAGNSTRVGGGIHAISATDVTVYGCVITGNTAQDLGGGIELCQVTGAIGNCTIARNVMSHGGGGINHNCNSAVAVNNCILYGNRYSGGASNQIAGNTAPVVSYSDVQGGYSGQGNIDADPRFYDPSNGDYRPGAGSPCIDTGSNALVPPELALDIDGWPRIVDGNNDGNAVVDMGAWEAQDCNHNSVPDFQDVLNGTSYDLNGNQIPDDCEDQSCRNLTTGQDYPTIAAAIAAAQNGHHLRSAPLAFSITPTIDFVGKQILLDSTGVIAQPSVGLVNITNNADFATAPGATLTVRGALRSANAAVADVSAGAFVLDPNATLRARLGSTLSIDATVGSALNGETFIETNATLSFTGILANAGTISGSPSATFAAADPFTNSGSCMLLNGTAVLGAATNRAAMNLPNVTLSGTLLTNDPNAQLTTYGQLYTDLTNGGDVIITGTTTLVGDVFNDTTGRIYLQIGATTLIGDLTNNGAIIGNFGPLDTAGRLDLLGGFAADPGATLRFAQAGTVFSVTGNYDNAINGHERFDLHLATLELRGALVPQVIEVMSTDRGPVAAGLDPNLPGNFPLGTLHIGAGAPATVQLVDNHDNDGQGLGTPECVYADTVQIDAGATLVNPNRRIYYNALVNHGIATDPANLVHIGPIVLPGDVNCDGAINFGDINPFVQILSDFTGWQAAHPGCPWQNGDCNGDGQVNFADINPFVALLTGAAE